MRRIHIFNEPAFSLSAVSYASLQLIMTDDVAMVTFELNCLARPPVMVC
jgi:hypothetical protein